MTTWALMTVSQQKIKSTRRMKMDNQAITRDSMRGWIRTARTSRLANALLALYERQTSQEKQAETTIVQNKQGFNSCDAEILTNMAGCWQRNKMFTDKQVNLIRKKLYKYAGQLAEIANTKKQADGANAQGIQS
jgi:hypothetical protein